MVAELHFLSCLRGPELVVDLLPLQQLLVAAALHHGALAHHADQVAVLDRAQPVGDRDARPTLDIVNIKPEDEKYKISHLHGSIQRVLHHLLGLGVQGACGLVQQQHRRVPNHSQ